MDYSSSTYTNTCSEKNYSGVGIRVTCTMHNFATNLYILKYVGHYSFFVANFNSMVQTDNEYLMDPHPKIKIEKGV